MNSLSQHSNISKLFMHNTQSNTDKIARSKMILQTQNKIVFT